MTGTADVSGARADDRSQEERSREGDHDRARGALERGDILPLERIMPIVRERFSGDVAEIEIEHDDGIWIYEFKVLDRSGRLIKVKIDAATGRVIKAGDD